MIDDERYRKKFRSIRDQIETLPADSDEKIGFILSEMLYLIDDILLDLQSVTDEKTED